MTRTENLVYEFHKAFGINTDYEWSSKTLALRLRLMLEEFAEFEEAVLHLISEKSGVDCDMIGDYLRYRESELMTEEDVYAGTELSEHALKVEVVDAMGDMEYINYGTADILGIPLDQAVDIIHDSNMSKLGDDGKPIINGQNGNYDPTRPIGKILKGPNYHKPYLDELVT